MDLETGKLVAKDLLNSGSERFPKKGNTWWISSLNLGAKGKWLWIFVSAHFLYNACVQSLNIVLKIQ